MLSLQRGRRWMPLLSTLRQGGVNWKLVTTEGRHSFVSDSATTTVATSLDWSPVTTVSLALDQAHQLTGLPWWAVLSLTAVSLRLVLLPLTIKQLQSTGPTMNAISQAVKIIKAQKKDAQWRLSDVGAVFEKFRKLSKYSDAPRPAWMLAAPLVQIPVFILFVVSIRRMCNSHWSGFAQGGTLWFPDLTQCTLQLSDLTAQLGPVGAILPVCITVAYLGQIHLSFQKGRLAHAAAPSTSRALSEFVRVGLEWLSIPVLIITLQLPQGALVYWFSSSLYSLSQSALLGTASVRQILRLPQIQDTSYHDVMAQFSPQVMDLFLSAAEHRAKGSHAEAVAALKQILQLDRHNARAHYALGQLHGEQQAWESAMEHYRASLEHERNPQLLSKGFLGLGVAQFMQNDYAASESSLLAALKLTPHDLTVLMALCSLYKRVGDTERAEATLQHAIDLDPRCKQWEKHL